MIATEFYLNTVANISEAHRAIPKAEWYVSGIDHLVSIL